jgi:hypothetical protein
VANLQKLIEENCTFVEDVYDEQVPTNAVYVFSKQVPCQKAEVRILKRMKAKFPLEFISRQASDTEKNMTQNESHLAGPSIVTLLNLKANKPKQLAFYPYAHHEVRFNDPNGIFFILK